MARKKKKLKVGQSKIVMRKVGRTRRRVRVTKLGRGKYRVRVIKRKSGRRR